MNTHNHPTNPPVGIPTRYQGRQYRSRLEARWACFFDLLGWRYEYEPCDFEGWIPDFVLCEAQVVYVEVKPVVVFPYEVTVQIDSTSCQENVLILGSTIRPRMGNPWEDCPEAFGWLGDVFPGEEHMRGWGPAVFGQWDAPRVGFFHAEQSFCDRITGAYSGAWGHVSRECETTIRNAWTEAGNVVQWKSPTPPPQAIDEAPAGFVPHILPEHIANHPDPRVRQHWARVYRKTNDLKRRLMQDPYSGIHSPMEVT